MEEWLQVTRPVSHALFFFPLKTQTQTKSGYQMKGRAEWDKLPSKAGTWKPFVHIYFGETVSFPPHSHVWKSPCLSGQNIRDLESLIWIWSKKEWWRGSKNSHRQSLCLCFEFHSFLGWTWDIVSGLQVWDNCSEHLHSSPTLPQAFILCLFQNYGCFPLLKIKLLNYMILLEIQKF